MSKRNDISTPEGYFEGLQQRLSEIPARPERVSPVHRLAPYVAFAASIAIAVVLGNAILRQTATPAPVDDGWTYVSYLTDSMDPDGVDLVDGSDWEEEGLSDEDIVKYLLSEGISIENYLSYEEGY